MVMDQQVHPADKGVQLSTDVQMHRLSPPMQLPQSEPHEEGEEKVLSYPEV